MDEESEHYKLARWIGVRIGVIVGIVGLYLASAGPYAYFMSKKFRFSPTMFDDAYTPATWLYFNCKLYEDYVDWFGKQGNRTP